MQVHEMGSPLLQLRWKWPLRQWCPPCRWRQRQTHIERDGKMPAIFRQAWTSYLLNFEVFQVLLVFDDQNKKHSTSSTWIKANLGACSLTFLIDLCVHIWLHPGEIHDPRSSSPPKKTTHDLCTPLSKSSKVENFSPNRTCHPSPTSAIIGVVQHLANARTASRPWPLCASVQKEMIHDMQLCNIPSPKLTFQHSSWK